MLLVSVPALGKETPYQGDLFSFSYPDTWSIVREGTENGMQHVGVRPKDATGVSVWVAGFQVPETSDSSELDDSGEVLSFKFLASFLKSANKAKDSAQATVMFGRMETAGGEQPSSIMMFPTPDGKSYLMAECSIVRTGPRTTIGVVVLKAGKPGILDSSAEHLAHHRQAYDIAATVKKRKAAAKKGKPE